ncbi:Forkhead transcription factor [Saxophila tyrrhenica]|uniref:Forkhead transcription factor n=1 Tax=Saxophila tyrrhenica TaxID=1690608 RepID=A0AAV9P467_9PEZI|nr:Forkhead transcription factor [Saxophila tyrrhenica]
MGSTRRPPSVDIYNDPDASFQHSGSSDVETALLNALGPLSDASNKQNMHFERPHTSAGGASPVKTDSSPMRPMSSNSLTEYRIPPPMQPDFNTDSPQKNANFYSAYAPPMHQRPETAPVNIFHQGLPVDKENFYDSNAFPGLPHHSFEEAEYGYKAPLKRTMSDSAPMKSGVMKKQKLEVEEPIILPDPKDLPSIQDDGTKPTYSYAELIGMAILRSPNRRLTLAQIYKWISDHYSFYKPSDSGWQNSIRHNLSLNKNFIKQERPKDDPGKGNYWAIKPGEERPFLMGKKNPVRRITNPDGSSYMNGLPGEFGYRTGNTPAIGNFTLAPGPVKKSETKAIDSAKFPDETELSSDGTIPASDPALQEDDKDDFASMMPPPAHIPSSPPPVELGSSPPPMLAEERKATPPPVPRFPSTSRSGNRRQKFAGLNDSGYWSSIESSAARGAPHPLTSEADMARPQRSKKGRAELEIARIRSSSFDSPNKDRLNFKAPVSHFVSSSPLRDDNPLTPAVVFKRPAKPPPSISPNTNLRNHRSRMRALLGTPGNALTPAKDAGLVEESFSPAMNNWSPAFNIGDDSNSGINASLTPYQPSKSLWASFGKTPGASTSKVYPNPFDIFIDAPEEDIAARGSPEKRSARRPSLARAATSTSILADITGSSKSDNVTLAPTSNSPFSLSPFISMPGKLRSPAKLGSPLKQSYKPPTKSVSPDDKWLDIGIGGENVHPGGHDTTDLFGGAHLPSDGSEEGIDLFQDFGKIGQAQQFHAADNRANGSPVKRSMPPPARPSLGRSNTSRW